MQNGGFVNKIQVVRLSVAKIHRHVFENPGDRHQVFQGSREIVLTMKEFQILVLLAQNKGRVFSKEQIYNVV